MPYPSATPPTGHPGYTPVPQTPQRPEEYQFPPYNTMMGGQMMTQQTPGMRGYQRDGMSAGGDNNNSVSHSPLDGHGMHHRYPEMRMGQRFKNPMLSGPGSQYQYDDVFVQNSPLVHHSTPSSLGPSSGASGRSSISHENDIGERMEAAIREIAVLRDKHQGQIDELVEEKNVLIAEIAEIQEALKRLEEKVNANGETSKSSKSVANQHKLLKDAVHTMFWNLCDIDQSLSERDRVKVLKPLEDGAAFVITQVDGKETTVWHPNCSLAVDAGVNRKFVKEIVDRVMDNEARFRQDKQGRLPDESYDAKIAEACAKTYLRTITSTWKKMQSGEGQEKLKQKTTTDRRRNRRSAVMQERRKAAVEFKRHWGYAGVEAMLDTDYASSVISVAESDISEDSKKRRQLAEAGKGANMVRGKTWRTKRYVKLLKLLDHLARKMKTAGTPAPLPTGQDEAGTSTQPSAPKKRKVSTKIKTARRTFYAAPSKMNQRPPASAKNPKRFPYVGMVRKSWRKTNDPDDLLYYLENVPWWGEFESKIQLGDISDDDQAYLDEIDEDSSADEET